jgi:hypothetical protein
MMRSNTCTRTHAGIEKMRTCVVHNRVQAKAQRAYQGPTAAVCYNIEHRTKCTRTQHNTRPHPKAQQKHNTTADHNDTSIEHKTKYYGTRQNRLLRVLHVSCGVGPPVQPCVSHMCYIETKVPVSRSGSDQAQPSCDLMRRQKSQCPQRSR